MRDSIMKEKPELIFACRWNKEIEKTWSGTAYAVYEELGKRFQISRFDLKDTFSILMYKLLRRMHLIKGNFSLLPTIRRYNRKFQKKYKDETKVVFQFDETPWTSQTINYIYQDLSIAYINYMRKHDPVAYVYSSFSNISERQLEKREQAQREFYQHCAGIFTMGQWLADFLHVECGIPVEKIHVVGAGVGIPVELCNDLIKTGNKILFVGKDFERKGGKLVVEAFQILRKNYRPDAELYIAGPVHNPIEKEIPGIHFVGNLSRNEVTKYYRMCDIFCMPSYFEAYGIAFCEALVYGLPCIARNKYAMPEIIRDREEGYLIDNDDASDLAYKMQCLLEDEQILQNVRSRQEFYQRKYSWEYVVNQMEQVIKRER